MGPYAHHAPSQEKTLGVYCSALDHFFSLAPFNLVDSMAVSGAKKFQSERKRLAKNLVSENETGDRGRKGVRGHGMRGLDEDGRTIT